MQALEKLFKTHSFKYVVKESGGKRRTIFTGIGKGTMPSGHPMTTFLNTLFTALLASYYAKGAGIPWRLSTISDFNPCFNPATAGDDAKVLIDGRKNAKAYVEYALSKTARNVTEPSKIGLG